MMRHGERRPLRIRPALSRTLAGFLLITHTAAASAAAALPLSWSLRSILFAAVVVSAVYGWVGHLNRRLPWAVREAVWEGSGTWRLISASGREREGRLSTSTYVSPMLVVLNFSCGGWRRCSLVLFADALDADSFRRLRARLRLSSRFVSGSAQDGI